MKERIYIKFFLFRYDLPRILWLPDRSVDRDPNFGLW